jgi:hypothetical protein
VLRPAGAESHAVRDAGRGTQYADRPGRNGVDVEALASLAPGLSRITPSLQASGSNRLVPDIASMASFIPGLATYQKDGGGWGVGGGTSAATLLTAAIVALVIQGERKAGRPADPTAAGRYGCCMYVSFGGPIFLIAVGAILRYATDINVAGVDMDVIGMILMIAGVATLILSFIVAIVNRNDRKPGPGQPPANRPPPNRPPPR